MYICSRLNMTLCWRGDWKKGMDGYYSQNTFLIQFGNFCAPVTLYVIIVIEKKYREVLTIYNKLVRSRKHCKSLFKSIKEKRQKEKSFNSSLPPGTTKAVKIMLFLFLFAFANRLRTLCSFQPFRGIHLATMLPFHKHMPHLLFVRKS